MQVKLDDYEELKAFYVRLLEIETEIEFGRPGRSVWDVSINPLTALQQIEAESKSKALRGLVQGIRDSLDTARHWNDEQLRRADAYLQRHGVPTLSEAQQRYDI